MKPLSAKPLPPVRPVRMGHIEVALREGADGVRYVSSTRGIAPFATRITDRLEHWAEAAPDRVFLADRGPDGAWRHLTFAEARSRARSLAQGLIERGLSADRPLVILSGNDIEHGLWALAAYYAGVPYAPVSPAYSLVSTDHSKLRHIFGLLEPGLVYVSDAAPFERALAAVMLPGIGLVAGRNGPAGAERFDDWAARSATLAVDDTVAATGPDTVAKFLFTSGSTGMPKAVINTQRMLCANQVMINSALAFLQDEPPVLVDWLPWNHTAGGNHNFGIALYNGGSLYIDDGAPTPQGIEKTVRNLTDVAPTLYFNVPKGYEALCAHLRANERLRENFFSRLLLMQYAGAGLAPHVFEELQDLAASTAGQRITMITGYGSTETAPFAFTATRTIDRPGNVGLPAPGLEIKLVPSGDKRELRVRGPNVTPGYWRQPDATAAAFDEEGYYRIGDALKLIDEDDPNAGFLFDGRISEDFKLATGTWVNMAGIRAGIVAAFAPYVRDAVIAGHDTNYISAMLFPDFAACRSFLGDDGADDAEVAADPALRALFQERLDVLSARSTGSSTRVARAVILADQPSIDAHELTDKGSINQRAVMASRAALVGDLYSDPAPSHILIAAKDPNP